MYIAGREVNILDYYMIDRGTYCLLGKLNISKDFGSWHSTFQGHFNIVCSYSIHV